MALWPTVEQEVKGGEVVDEIPPKLRVHRGGGCKEVQLNTCFGKQVSVQVFTCGGLGQVRRCLHLPANLYQQLVSFGDNVQVGLEDQGGVDPQMFFQIVDDRQIQIDEFFKFSQKHFLHHITMLLEVGGVGIAGFQAGQTLFPPVALMTYSNLAHPLKAQTFFPNRDPDPQGTLIILKAISGDPGGSHGKLNLIQDDHHIGKVSLIEEGRKRGEKGLTG